MNPIGRRLIAVEPFSEIVIGNTAVVRGMVEAGIRVVTSYPGSPTPEIAEAIRAIPPADRPFYFEFSVNEKVAMEVACGAALNGHPSTVFFKSVGLNVALDTFMQLSMIELTGGLVVVVGDDPGSHSSQNEQDNRLLAQMAYVPVLEPATPTEAYLFFKEAATLARARRMPVLLRLATHSCHHKERVEFAGHTPETADWTPRFDPGKGPFVPVPSAVPHMKRRALEKLRSLAEYADASPANRIEGQSNRERGIITAGVPFLSVMDVVAAATDRPDILKLGLIHPLPRGLIRRFLESHAEVAVVEELDDVLEKEIKRLAFEWGLDLRIHGKQTPDDRIGEYTPDKVASVLARLWPDMVPATPPPPPPAFPAPARPPQLCPGCGHRSAFHAFGGVLREDDITVSDIGCYTLGFLPPHRMGQVLMCMGASPGLAAGMTLGNRSRRVVAFIGDSTLFHAGLPGIVNAVFNRHPFTLVIMDNGTTAMTGHQDHPGSGRNFAGDTRKIPLRDLLRGLGVRSIREVGAYQQKKLQEALREALEENEVSVVIARHPCMLQFTRRQRRKPDYRRRRVRIDPDRCQHLLTCIRDFACPSFVETEDGRITVNPDLCIGDGSCIQTCTARAITGEDAGKSNPGGDA